MSVKHVYDLEGFWIAFIVDSEVFLREGDWFGRLSGEHEVRDQNGDLVGLLDERDCLLMVKAGPSRLAPTLGNPP